MGLFTNWLKKKEPEQETRGLFCDSLMYNMNGGYTTNKAMLLSTVYRCVDVISDAVAQLPFGKIGGAVHGEFLLKPAKFGFFTHVFGYLSIAEL